MINEGIFSDYDKDGDPDLIIAAEQQSIAIFENDNGKFNTLEIPELDKYKGWYQSIEAYDYDHDGDEDYFVGNMGMNNKFHPNTDKPLHIYADYFDENNSFDIILSKKIDGNLVPVKGKQFSTEQTPFLDKKIATYNQFANATLDQIYGKEKLDKAFHLFANNFESVLIENLGNKKFKQTKLPNQCQIGPTLDFLIHDIDDNRFGDIIGVGNICEAEVETIRYDAAKDFVLDIEQKQISSNISSFFPLNKNTKALKKIRIKDKTYFILFNNNEALSIYKLLE